MQSILPPDSTHSTADDEIVEVGQAEFVAYVEAGLLGVITWAGVWVGHESWRDMRIFPLMAAAAAGLGFWLRRRRSTTAALLLIALNMLGFAYSLDFKLRLPSALTAIMLAWPYARAYRALTAPPPD
jgi:hypothetical protein